MYAFVCDVVQGKVDVYEHEPITISKCDCGDASFGAAYNGVAVSEKVLYFAESNSNAIAFEDLPVTGGTLLTVEKLKGNLEDIGTRSENYERKPKKCINDKLREALNTDAISKQEDKQNLCFVH